ncbi:TM2 domain-containing protein [Luteimicrobium subarcticum]|uniref:TM2 domain-containing protein n=1 Tax=Luteimicrobium subarcticum TaxID=620910 RepID=A0A2M8WS11_9MICO|nr:TM2 domain-containing protein [Luteimicrobium subarcticum]PJI93735.1 TM2 domain-containing protein [Luteimicrobium subarcticum]
MSEQYPGTPEPANDGAEGTPSFETPATPATPAEGQPPADGQAPFGQPEAQVPYGEQEPYGQAPTGQAPYGQAPYADQAPYGQAPYGQAPYAQAPYGQAPYGAVPPGYAPGEAPKTKLAAGLLGIFLGGFGVHRFYLGDTKMGLIQIGVTIVTCGLGHIWGFVEGILYLTATEGTYSVDAKGRKLV